VRLIDALVQNVSHLLGFFGLQEKSKPRHSNAAAQIKVSTLLMDSHMLAASRLVTHSQFESSSVGLALPLNSAAALVLGPQGRSLTNEMPEALLLLANSKFEGPARGIFPR
jgi:hypothetical protein